MPRTTLRSILALGACALTITAAPGSATAQEGGLRGGELVARIDSLAHTIIDDGTAAGLTIGVQLGDEVAIARGYGFADLELGVPATEQTVFRIGSITKQFTAAMIMKRVESGEIVLDAPITDYLPDYPMQGRTVTVRDLLDHTSGIRSYTAMESWAPSVPMPITQEELVATFSAEPFDFEPGAEFSYNNSGYFLLGVILTRLSGTPYRELVEAEVFEPLGMSSSTYCDEKRIIPNRAEGYDSTPTGFVNDDPLSMDHPGAAGALCSTVPDLLRWARALRNGEYVSRESYETMATSSVLNDGSETGYGFGLGVGEFEGRALVSHGGGINGFVTNLAHLPELDADVVVLSNTPGGHPGTMTLDILRWVLGIETPAVVDLELDAELLARYEGVYEIQPGFELTVRARDGSLWAQATGQGENRLKAQGDHRFVPTFDDTASVTFHFEGDDTVALTLVQGGARVRAPRIR